MDSDTLGHLAILLFKKSHIIVDRRFHFIIPCATSLPNFIKLLPTYEE
jgi:hypothetical protein